MGLNEELMLDAIAYLEAMGRGDPEAASIVLPQGDLLRAQMMVVAMGRVAEAAIAMHPKPESVLPGLRAAMIEQRDAEG